MERSTENETTQPTKQSTGHQSNAAATNPARQFNLKFGYQDKGEAAISRLEIASELILQRTMTIVDLADEQINLNDLIFHKQKKSYHSLLVCFPAFNFHNPMQ